MNENKDKPIKDESTKEDDIMLKKIDKTNINGLTADKKEILKKLLGTVKSPLDINKMRDEMKYAKN